MVLYWHQKTPRPHLRLSHGGHIFRKFMVLRHEFRSTG